jgi:NitT/TauT family transport system ATP-binding protein
MKLQIESVTQIFINGSPKRTALVDFSLSVDSGQFVALIGPSGCGKTTLLRLVGDLQQPTQGSITLDGKSPAEMRHGHAIAWMAQSPALLPWLDARQNVALAQQFIPANGHPHLSVDEVLLRVGLNDVSQAYPFTLSGGMQQRLALARLLAMDARLWLMDEPFAALDEMTRERLTAELLELWQPIHPTVLWVTHNIYEALRLADRVVVFTPSPGRIAADVNINLPRPRREDDPQFQQTLATVRSALVNPANHGITP